MRGKAFRGTPLSMAIWQPWIAPAHFQKFGFLLGYNLRTGKRVHLYPWTLNTNGTTCQIEGEKNSGKSTFLKTIIDRGLGFQARDFYGEPTLMRGRLSARKSEQGESEITPLARALHAEVYDLNESGGINIFGLFEEESDLVEVAINVAQDVAGHMLGEKVSLAIMVGIRYMMANMLQLKSVPVLEQILRGLTIEDFAEYHKENRIRATVMFEQELKDRPKLFEDLQINLSAPVIGRDYLSAASTAADCLTQFLYGDYGKVFVGKNNLHDVLSNQLSALNWQNLPTKAANVLESVLMKAESSAIVALKDKKVGALDRSSIIPHINMSDEEGGAMKNLMHVRFAADRQNKSRAFPEASFRAVQYHTQVTEAGSDGSEIRGLAKEIELGVGYRIIFRQPNDTSFLHRFSTLGMSDPDIEMLPKLRRGQAALWIRDRPPLFFQHVVLPQELPLIQSNSARLNMANPIPLAENEVYLKRMELVRVAAEKEIAESTES